MHFFGSTRWEPTLTVNKCDERKKHVGHKHTLRATQGVRPVITAFREFMRDYWLRSYPTEAARARWREDINAGRILFGHTSYIPSQFVGNVEIRCYLFGVMLETVAFKSIGRRVCLPLYTVLCTPKINDRWDLLWLFWIFYLCSSGQSLNIIRRWMFGLYFNFVVLLYDWVVY